VGRERSLGRGDRGVDLRPARRGAEWEVARGGLLGPASPRQSVLLSATYPYNVPVPESRSSGAIRSERAAALDWLAESISFEIGCLSYEYEQQAECNSGNSSSSGSG